MAHTSGRDIRVKTMADITEEATKAVDLAWEDQVVTMAATAEPTFPRTSSVSDAKSQAITSETAPKMVTHFTTHASERVSRKLTCGKGWLCQMNSRKNEALSTKAS